MLLPAPSSFPPEDAGDVDMLADLLLCWFVLTAVHHRKRYTTKDTKKAENKAFLVILVPYRALSYLLGIEIDQRSKSACQIDQMDDAPAAGMWMVGWEAQRSSKHPFFLRGLGAPGPSPPAAEAKKSLSPCPN